jgi:GPI mannosyltransferase 1 subunit M
MKIYPIIYSLALYFHIDQSASLRLTYRRLQFVLSFIISTFLLNAYFYYRYGYEYLYETYIYHIVRRDARHNFSPYFYLTYLSPQSSFLSLITFLPQVINTLVCSYRLYDRLELCLFSLTYAFVTFNKVTTSQYFLWYLIFLPILLPYIQLKWKTLLVCLTGWLLAQAWWLYEAYQLEFQAQNTFVHLWLSSIVFGLVNVCILCTMIYYYRQLSTNDITNDTNTLKKKTN